MITLEALKKHASKFGPEGVVELAVENGANLHFVSELIEFVDALKEKEEGAWFKRPRKSAVERASKLLGLEEEE